MTVESVVRELSGRITTRGKLDMGVIVGTQTLAPTCEYMSPPYFQEALCGLLKMYTQLKYATQNLNKCVIGICNHFQINVLCSSTTSKYKRQRRARCVAR